MCFLNCIDKISVFSGIHPLHVSLFENAPVRTSVRTDLTTVESWTTQNILVHSWNNATDWWVFPSARELRRPLPVGTARASQGFLSILFSPSLLVEIFRSCATISCRGPIHLTHRGRGGIGRLVHVPAPGCMLSRCSRRPLN